ncbi:hypothetical protein ACFOPX_04990 [Helicobacter baculiformis]|uniref:Uncharacterized protein n=1 Tax=Helicobacter baculiformis TaxID=427351 RepID=A0ABV7ZID8_9HELI|nr:hypothetical protein [Helicobacter baculiformis]
MAEDTKPLEELEPLPSPPPLGAMPQALAPLEHTPPTLESIEEEFSALLEGALNKQDNWKQQIYLCLQAISRVLMAFNAFKGLYDRSYALLQDLDSQARAQVDTLQMQAEHLNTLIRDYYKHFEALKAGLHKHNAVLGERFKAGLEQVDLVQKLIQSAKLEADRVLIFKDSIVLLLEKLESLAPLQERLVELQSQSKAHVKVLEELLAQSLTQIQDQSQSAITRLDALVEAARVSVNAQVGEFDTHVQEAQAHLEEEFSARFERVDGHIQGFKEEFTHKIDALEEYLVRASKIYTQMEQLQASTLTSLDEGLIKYNTNAQECLHVYNTNDTQKLQEYNDNAYQKLQDYNASVDAQIEHARLQVAQFNSANLAKLEEFKAQMENINAQKLEELNANTLQKIEDYNANHLVKLGLYDTHASQGVQQAQEALKAFKQEMLDQVLAGSKEVYVQFGLLQGYLEQLQAKQTKLGGNFQAVKLESSQEWEVPQDGMYYYVFLQAGAESTSFGDALSVSGDSRCVSGWVQPKGSKVNVKVGDGGCCVISWATRIA